MDGDLAGIILEMAKKITLLQEENRQQQATINLLCETVWPNDPDGIATEYQIVTRPGNPHMEATRDDHEWEYRPGKLFS